MREPIQINGGNKLIHFSHWTRKSYAIFNSLKKVIKISCLAVALINLSFISKVEAQQDTNLLKPTDYELDEFEVIGQKAPVLYSDLSRVVTIVSRKEIESSPAQSLQEVLQFVHSVDLRQRGANDIQADINLRGGSFDQTLILLNGIPVNDPQTGHHSLDLPVTLDQIDHIEILAGPGSRVLGSNAYSGAINIVTKSAKNRNLQLSTNAGEYGLLQFTESISFKGKKISNFLSTSQSKSNGYINNTDFDKFNVFYSGNSESRKSKFLWQGGISNKSFGANSFYTAKYPNQYENTKLGFGSIQHQYRGKINLRNSIFFRGHTDRFELFRSMENAPSWYKSHNYHLSQAMGINSVAYAYTKYGKTSFGMDLRFENIHSNVLGIQLSDTISALFDEEGFYTKYDERKILSTYIEHCFQYKKFQFSGGIMANNTNTFSNIHWAPGIDLGYDIHKNIRIFMSWNTSMRLPTFTDLYYKGPTNVGNPNLKPEQSMNYEIGLKLRKDWISTEISFYKANGKNTIDWVRKASNEKWQPQNITELNSYGLETSVKIDLQKWKIPYLKTFDLSVTKNEVSKSSGNMQSFYTMDYLNYKLTAKLYHAIYKKINASWTFRLQDRNGNFLLYDAVSNKETEVNYKQFCVLDGKINYLQNQWNAYISVSNIFNSSYFDYGNLVQAGRWISIGFNCNFNL